MRKPAKELIDSILDEHAQCKKEDVEKLEAKSLFKLLNYCPLEELSEEPPSVEVRHRTDR